MYYTQQMMYNTPVFPPGGIVPPMGLTTPQSPFGATGTGYVPGQRMGYPQTGYKSEKHVAYGQNVGYQQKKPYNPDEKRPFNKNAGLKGKDAGSLNQQPLISALTESSKAFPSLIESDKAAKEKAAQEDSRAKLAAEAEERKVKTVWDEPEYPEFQKKQPEDEKLKTVNNLRDRMKIKKEKVETEAPKDPQAKPETAQVEQKKTVEADKATQPVKETDPKIAAQKIEKVAEPPKKEVEKPKVETKVEAPPKQEAKPEAAKPAEANAQAQAKPTPEFIQKLTQIQPAESKPAAQPAETQQKPETVQPAGKTPEQPSQQAAQQPAESAANEFFIDPSFIKNYLNNFKKSPPPEIARLNRKLVPEQSAKNRKPAKDTKPQKARSDRLDVSKPVQKAYERPEEPKEMLSRPNYSEEALKEINMIKTAADMWLYDHKQDDSTKLQRTLTYLLNKLSVDNFQSVSDEVMQICQNNEQNVTQLVEAVVNKAWNEPIYTNCYAQLMQKLMSVKQAWDTSPKKDGVRSKVLFKIEHEYNTGFQKYYDFSKQIMENKELSAEEKFEKISKKKTLLLGNINFICELFELKVLSFYVIKWVVILGLCNFIINYIQNLKQADAYSVREDYLEALLRLFEISGRAIQRKEEEHNVPNSKVDEDVEDKFRTMMDNKVDKTEEFFVYIDKKIRQIKSITNIFFNFLDEIKDEKASVRLSSLIDNLIELRKQGWEKKIRRNEKARKIEDIKRDLENEKEKSRMDFNEREKDREDSRKAAKKQPPKTYNKMPSVSETSMYIKKETIKERTYDELKPPCELFIKGASNQTNVEQFERVIFPADCKNYTLLLKLYIDFFGLNIKNLSVIDNRVQVGLKFFKEGLVTKEDFKNTIKKALPELALVECDEPYIGHALARLLYQLRENDYLSSLEETGINDAHTDLQDNDDKDEYNYFVSQVKKNITNYFNEKGKEKYAEELKKFNNTK